jgi:hypothetical protein
MQTNKDLEKEEEGEKSTNSFSKWKIRKAIIKIYKDDERKALNALEELTELEETGEVESQKSARSFGGCIIRVKVFEKSYRLVPQDTQLRENFYKSYKLSLGDSKYSASVIGEGISDIRARNSADGRKVAYYFKLNFSYEWDQIRSSQQPKMPWIKIIHEIPNIYYNEAAILNINSYVNQMLKLKSDIEDELKVIIQFGRLLDQKLIQLKKQKEELEDLLERLESKLAFLSSSKVLVEGEERENMQTTNQTLGVCQEFIEEFDTHLEAIEREVEQDLAI